MAISLSERLSEFCVYAATARACIDRTICNLPYMFFPPPHGPCVCASMCELCVCLPACEDKVPVYRAHKD